MNYDLFREFADSWGLVYLVILFVGVILFTFRPGSRDKADEIAQIPFKEDETDG
ncbi:MAG: cbb3-type cytochrome c oxidase subunit 3 [Roseovarius sp.]|nr:cbb3-type cytochrome c oxidase subunit 3 [Roseovarius sp.]MCY4207704.1 cbb3-type cytochrome c oxidase subunit 3 [Roseovarius sp.]MCY4290506.1 cbb3-type cytochrome c oxidase subunit 3 [Roseovarius sp.]MCY4316900.1 cbb3-type cytochrome c oxidase subunit 3 [Roseovarius sp.]